MRIQNGIVWNRAEIDVMHEIKKFFRLNIMVMHQAPHGRSMLTEILLLNVMGDLMLDLQKIDDELRHVSLYL